jgi:hypothetical protein
MRNILVSQLEVVRRLSVQSLTPYPFGSVATTQDRWVAIQAISGLGSRSEVPPGVTKVLIRLGYFRKLDPGKATTRLRHRITAPLRALVPPTATPRGLHERQCYTLETADA